MGEAFAGIASGPLLLAVAMAALAAIVSFFAPCMVSYMAGLAGTDLAPSAGGVPRPAAIAVAAHLERGMAFPGSALFVAGVTAVLVTVGYAAGALGRAMLVHARTTEIVAGVPTILLGLAFAGVLPGAARTWSISRLPADGLAGARGAGCGVRVVLDAAPVTDADRGAQAGRRARVGRARSGPGRRLLAGHEAAVCQLRGRLRRAIGFVRRHGAWVVTRLGGALLVTVGLALVTGAWTEFVNWLRATTGPGQIGI